eukprot:Trichotokara_eunicae@DN3210_c0_g1_i1.p1
MPLESPPTQDQLATPRPSLNAQTFKPPETLLRAHTAANGPMERKRKQRFAEWDLEKPPGPPAPRKALGGMAVPSQPATKPPDWIRQPVATPVTATGTTPKIVSPSEGVPAPVRRRATIASTPQSVVSDDPGGGSQTRKRRPSVEGATILLGEDENRSGNGLLSSVFSPEPPEKLQAEPTPRIQIGIKRKAATLFDFGLKRRKEKD